MELRDAGGEQLQRLRSEFRQEVNAGRHDFVLRFELAISECERVNRLAHLMISLGYADRIELRVDQVEIREWARQVRVSAENRERMNFSVAVDVVLELSRIGIDAPIKSRCSLIFSGGWRPAIRRSCIFSSGSASAT